MGYHIAHLGTYLYVNVKLCQTHTNTGGTLNMITLFHFYLLRYILSTSFNSLGHNAIGHVGALQLADALKVNQSLRSLE